MSVSISVFYVIPFFALILSIALFPLFSRTNHFWEKYYWIVVLVCSVALLIPFAVQYSPLLMVFSLIEVLLDEYVPFVLMVGSLYIVSGGIVLEGKLPGTPLTNTLLFLIGIPLASIFGTTGASMVLIRPLLHSISHRVHDTHTVIFFIFIICNMAGGLTPIGNPPVFVGFLAGVDFFWPLINVILPTVLSCGYLLMVYYAIDLYYFRQEPKHTPHLHTIPEEREVNFLEHNISTQDPESDINTDQIFLSQNSLSDVLIVVKEKVNTQSVKPDSVSFSEKELHVENQEARWAAAEVAVKKGFRIRGWRNVALVVLIAVTIIIAGLMQKTYPDAHFLIIRGPASQNDFNIHYASLSQSLLLLGFAALSVYITPERIWIENNFTFHPLVEVAILFIGIFVTLKPILMMFDERECGALGGVITVVTQPWHYFWVSGVMSGFLDNAPAYLLFFNVAGGNAEMLMG
ncbi:hypothetical protein HK096_007860, partial [Nowakowskiella sp. JEL0078]